MVGLFLKMMVRTSPIHRWINWKLKELALTRAGLTGKFKHEHLIPRDRSLEDTVPSLQGEEKRRFLEFVMQMLQWLPENRKTARQLLEDPWLSDESIRNS